MKLLTECATLFCSQELLHVFVFALYKTLHSCLYPVGFSHLVPDVLSIQPVISRQVVSSGINSFQGF